MRRRFALGAALTAASLGCAPAFALGQRTFVSGTGTDSGACSRAAPCRSLQFAHDQTAPNDEIAILDTAGYGVLTITKAISVVNPGGVEAGITVPANGTAISVVAGAGDSISLRGLTLDGQAAAGTKGISVTSAGQLQILDCVVRNFDLTAIQMRPTDRLAICCRQYCHPEQRLRTVGQPDVAEYRRVWRGQPADRARSELRRFRRRNLDGHEYAELDDHHRQRSVRQLRETDRLNRCKRRAPGRCAALDNRQQHEQRHLSFRERRRADHPHIHPHGDTTIANNPKGIRFEHTATVSSLGNNMFTDNGVDLDGGTLAALAPK